MNKEPRHPDLSENWRGITVNQAAHMASGDAPEPGGLPAAKTGNLDGLTLTYKADTSAALREVRALRLELQKAGFEAQRLAEELERVNAARKASE